MSGHTREKCFILHAYPEQHKLHGHPKPKLRSAHNKKSSNSSMSTANVTATESSPASTPLDHLPGLSQDQYKQIINMLQAQVKLKP